MASESPSDRLEQRHKALSRWENEGGAVRQLHEASDDEGLSEAPALTNTELVQLRVRVIALENVVISLLARTSPDHADLVREMAAYISPRPGFTHHAMTIRAADQMLGLLERSGHFRQEADENS